MQHNIQLCPCCGLPPAASRSWLQANAATFAPVGPLSTRLGARCGVVWNEEFVLDIEPDAVSQQLNEFSMIVSS